MKRGASPVARLTVIEEIHALLKADLADETPLRYQPIRPAHWQIARLAATVTARTGEVPFQRSAATRIDGRAVERFRAEIGRFAAAGNDVGGSDASGDRGRDALIAYLIANVSRLARRGYGEQVGRALFSAIAQAMWLLACLTFDVTPETVLTQKYFGYARQLAHRADDRLLEAAVMATMSQQARHAGMARDAKELAAAARKGTSDGDPPCVRFFDESESQSWKPIVQAVCARPVCAGRAIPLTAPLAGLRCLPGHRAYQVTGPVPACWCPPVAARRVPGRPGRRSAVPCRPGAPPTWRAEPRCSACPR